MNEAQAVALAEKHGAISGVKKLHCTQGNAIVIYPDELAAMLTDHRAQVIEELAQRTGVMPEPFTHGGDENTCDADEAREALATMQAKLEQAQADAARHFNNLRNATNILRGFIVQETSVQTASAAANALQDYIDAAMKEQK